MEKLKMKDVSLTYQSLSGETKALEDITFSVSDGEFIAIVGPSGCGKTTILSLVSGLIAPSEGEIFINGEPVRKPNGKVGYMLQRDQLFEWRTIESNVILGLEICKKATRENKEYARELLEKYGLGDFKKSFPNELSGGMRQRAALIRTLSFRPEILLLDEAFSALDFQTRLAVCDDVYDIIKKEKKTALLVTHDISEAVSMADKIIVLSQRPAKIKNIYTPDLPVVSPLKRREEPTFSKWFDIIWKEVSK